MKKQLTDLERKIKKQEKWEMFLFNFFEKYFFMYVGLSTVLFIGIIILFWYVLALAIVLLIGFVFQQIAIFFLIEYFRKVDFIRCYNRKYKEKEQK